MRTDAVDETTSGQKGVVMEIVYRELPENIRIHRLLILWHVVAGLACCGLAWHLVTLLHPLENRDLLRNTIGGSVCGGLVGAGLVLLGTAVFRPLTAIRGIRLDEQGITPLCRIRRKTIAYTTVNIPTSLTTTAKQLLPRQKFILASGKKKTLLAMPRSIEHFDHLMATICERSGAPETAESCQDALHRPDATAKRMLRYAGVAGLGVLLGVQILAAGYIGMHRMLDNALEQRGALAEARVLLRVPHDGAQDMVRYLHMPPGEEPVQDLVFLSKDAAKEYAPMRPLMVRYLPEHPEYHRLVGVEADPSLSTLFWMLLATTTVTLIATVAFLLGRKPEVLGGKFVFFSR